MVTTYFLGFFFFIWHIYIYRVYQLVFYLDVTNRPLSLRRTGRNQEAVYVLHGCIKLLVYIWKKNCDNTTETELILTMRLHIDYFQIIQILFLLWSIFLKKNEIAVALCISVNLSHTDPMMLFKLHYIKNSFMSCIISWSIDFVSYYFYPYYVLSITAYKYIEKVFIFWKSIDNII